MSTTSVPPSPPPSPTVSELFPDEIIEEDSPNETNESQPQPLPPHSPTTAKYLGKKVPLNTIKSNETSLRRFCHFVYERYYTSSISTRFDLVISLNKEKRANQLMQKRIEFTRKLVFSDDNSNFLPPNYSTWTNAQLIKLRFYLIEFVVNYRSTDNNKELAPSSMKAYLLGLQRAFNVIWQYDVKILQGHIFNCEKQGLVAVIDNRFSEQQATGSSTVSHNTLQLSDISKIYKSHFLSQDTASGFQARLVFHIALVTALRPTALCELLVTDFQKINCNDEQIWILKEKIGSRIGASKTNHGGWKAVKDKQKEIPIWNRSYFGGSLNIYEDIEKYMQWRQRSSITTNRFFLAVNQKAFSFNTLFKNQNLGRNKLSEIVKNTCKSLNIRDCGGKEDVVLHGLRGTVATLLFEKGHSDSSVSMRTGHRDVRSLKSYQILRGTLGLQQQQSIFGCNEEKEVKKRHEDNDINTTDAKRQKTDDTLRSLNVLSNIRDVRGSSINVTINVSHPDVANVDKKEE